MKYNTEVIGNIIKMEREKRNMSQVALGKELGVVGKQISNYENGKTQPPIEVLFKLCETFDCELGYLLGESNYSQGTIVNTIICNKTGLTIDAVNAIIKITGTERSCPNWGYESEKYRRILSNLFITKEFSDFVQALADLDEEYSKKEQTKTLLQQFYDEIGETLSKKAIEFDGVIVCDEEASGLTSEEINVILKFGRVLDECRKKQDKFEHEMKFHRFTLQESLTLLLNAMYPMTDML